jgi:hypothetical protein
MQERNVSYSKILDFLTTQIDKTMSGTLFIHSSCNRAITIALDSGEIHALYMGAKRGRKAIPLISNITGGSYRFEVSDLVEANHDLPPTHEILHLLRKPHGSSNNGSALSIPTSISAKTSTKNNNTNNPKGLPDEKIDILCQELKGLLSEHLGPIADVLFDDTVDEVGNFYSSPEMVESLINKLSEEIDNNNEAKHFISSANVIINSVLLR